MGEWSVMVETRKSSKGTTVDTREPPKDLLSGGSPLLWKVGPDVGYLRSVQEYSGVNRKSLNNFYE